MEARLIGPGPLPRAFPGAPDGGIGEEWPPTLMPTHVLEHGKTPGKAQGPDPGRIPGSGPTESCITATIKRVQVSGRSLHAWRGFFIKEIPMNPPKQR